MSFLMICAAHPNLATRAFMLAGARHEGITMMLSIRVICTVSQPVRASARHLWSGLLMHFLTRLGSGRSLRSGPISSPLATRGQEQVF